MGKGDKKSKKGKLFMGSRGKSRPSRVTKAAAAAVATEEAPAKKKAAPKKKKAE